MIKLSRNSFFSLELKGIIRNKEAIQDYLQDQEYDYDIVETSQCLLVTVYNVDIETSNKIINHLKIQIL